MSTFVLVHGAWLGSWAWRKIRGQLEEKGNEVHAITLTGMGERVHLAREEYGMETATQDVVNLLHYEDLHDVVLVGHSFAGKVISTVYERVPDRIRLLLYLDAFVPDRTRGPQGGREQMSKEEMDVFDAELEKEGSGWKLGIPDQFLDDLTWDLRGKDREWFFSRITPWPSRLNFDSISIGEKVDNARKAYIFCNRSWDDAGQDWKDVLASLEGPYRLMTTAHYPMITKPDETVKNLIELSS